MAHASDSHTSLSNDRAGVAGISWLVCGLVVVAAGLPVVGVVMQLIQGWRSAASAPPPESPLFVWSSIWTTILYSVLIAALATLLSLPAAWTMRQARAWRGALIGVPLLMPSYLTYAGWGMVRAPGTWFGDWLAHGPPARSLAFDKVLAVIGLALWAWPIGTLLIGAAARRVPGHLLDALDLEPGSGWRKMRVVLGMLRGSIVASVALIALIMAGSAVPLQLAQIDTYAIHLWIYLTLAADAAAVWKAAPPLVVIAGVAAWVMVKLVERPRLQTADEGETPERRGSLGIEAATFVIWVLSVVAPMVLFALNLRHWRSLGWFWKNSAEAIGVSVRTAGVVGAATSVLAMGAWAMRACRSRGAKPDPARLGLWVFLTSALIPGVLVGLATLAFWNSRWLPRAAGDSMWPIVCAHIARFGFVGMLGGWWLAGLETSDERGARLMAAGQTIRGWAVLCVRPQLGAVIGLGLATAALSLHEIESTVLLKPAGQQSLAEQLLNDLHYNRNDELCAACMNVTAVGVVLAACAGWLVGRAGTRRSERR